MSIDYLETLERDINCGEPRFACPGTSHNQFHIANSAQALRQLAQTAANVRHIAANIYQLVNKKEVMTGDVFLVVRKILSGGSIAAPNFEWSIIDTLDAAEVMRDVSQGPTPLFGAVIAETVNPK